jgi:nucleoside-diphosphate-sugar epimerase
MRCFVTGGSGFIGQALIKILELKGHETFNYDVLEGYDIKNEGRLITEVDNFNPDIIFHFAGLLGTSNLMSNPILTEETNVIGTINVLDVAVGFRIPVVFASKPLPANWYNPYNISKRAAENYCEMYKLYHEVKVTILKFFNVYGPGQYYTETQKFIPSFIHHALKNEPIPIYGSGHQLVDPVYIDDCIHASIEVMKQQCWGKTIDVGSGINFPVQDIARHVIKITGSDSELTRLPMRKGEIEILDSLCMADPRPAYVHLGIKPGHRVWLEKGLRETLLWWAKEHDV